MFAGYASRIEKEIKALYIEKGLKNTKDKSIKVPINIIDSPRRKYSVFIGATIFANLSNKEQAIDYWISKQDWEESGPKIILKKCANILK